jgi:hypothetical protein
MQLKSQATRYSDVHLQADTGDGTRTPALNSGADFLAKAKFLLAAEMDKVGAALLRVRRWLNGSHRVYPRSRD